MSNFIPRDDIRSLFSAAMSAMYRAEVPLYAQLLDIVATVNARTLEADVAQAESMSRRGELARIDAERHGAIRVGTPAELRALARVFAVMGMEPVGYYDLAAAGIPVHSTAFRPIGEEALARNPFRVFTSLLRPELIADEDLSAQALDILASRRIVSDECMALVEKAEAEGGLNDSDAQRFVAAALEIFRWHSHAIVDTPTYERLLASHRLVADIVSFKGPHINHLTPRTLDIDAAQAEMLARGIAAKDSIEGPPRRKVPILLRQTSFHALSESFIPADADSASAQHTARFGEIEQRGAALTPKGRALYDECLTRSRDDGMSLEMAFADFPDNFAEMVDEGLAYARHVTNDDGTVTTEPIAYEDFLPVSAAGIFRSNLGEEVRGAYAESASQDAFEQALGRPVHDPFALYAAIATRSRADAMHA
ncbi:VOC family protein [Croceicoccus mobilis]|uniref:2-oxoadipate dioxygenase/decarboxylase n=1 Tax=Croceicoccus mobilis TaxID=1703339 RepID=A0A916Z5B6_9SPHN|nr:VOC family protein [Croceicoccus mobilis]GGD74499.1 DUF1338 domain-containing protein [Croceicoccus mobilis]